MEVEGIFEVFESELIMYVEKLFIMYLGGVVRVVVIGSMIKVSL